MISKEDALLYKEQLHPAYAGYLHDGEITDKDILASIFHLMKTGIVLPIFEENNMNKKIVSLRQTNKKPYYSFEELILKNIFKDSKEISTNELNKIISTKNVHKILLENINSIAKFPLINKKLKFLLGKNGEATFTLNGKEVTTVELANQFNTTLTKIILPIFIFIGVLFLVLGFVPFEKLQNISSENITISTNVNGEFNSRQFFSFMSLGFIGIPLLIYLTFKHSTKVFNYQFENNIVPFAKEHYEELFTFLKNHPMENHNFNNEFLPYSIAFGIDSSWKKDFMLEDEVQISDSSLGKNL